MFAIFETGGKQYQCQAGVSLTIDKLAAEVGDVVTFDKVLLLCDKEPLVGTPYVDKVSVEAKVVAHGRHKKIQIIKFKRRKHHMKSMGHRQDYTEIEVVNIATK